MVNTLNPCPVGASGCATFPPINDTSNQDNLAIFANTAVESYLQSSSCMDCHGGASGYNAPQPLTGTNQIFTFVLLNAYSAPSTTLTAAQSKFRNLIRKPPHSMLVAAPNAATAGKK